MSAESSASEVRSLVLKLLLEGPKTVAELQRELVDTGLVVGSGGLHSSLRLLEGAGRIVNRIRPSAPEVAEWEYALSESGAG